jgi:putative FmdB family regulatory protein
MPIYEYSCPKCGEFEVTQRITEDPLKKCPTCKTKVRKLISNTSFQLKGSGWYVTDYAGKKSGDKDGAKEGAKESSKENSSEGSKEASTESAKSSGTESKTESKPKESSKSSKSSKKDTGAKAA